MPSGSRRGPGPEAERFARAIAAIDAVNAQDENRSELRGERLPRELARAQRVSEWIEQLQPGASEALRLAGRAAHIGRWQYPRSEYPAGRVGYLLWRKQLQQKHAEAAAGILRAQGYDENLAARVQSLICKQGLGRDGEVQVLEDALCLVFLETQYHDLLLQLPEEKLHDVLRKTLRRMSQAGIALAARIPLAAEDRARLEAAARSLKSP